jgi:hypothetical protein
LDIGAAGTSLVLSWPAFAQGYTLQATPVLTPAQWQNVVTSSNQWSLDPTNAMQFFRLIKP